MDLKNKVIEINNLISSNKFPQALSKCESLIKKVPNNSYLFNLMGLILQQCNKLNSSIIYFHKSLSIQKDNYAAMNNLAISYKNLFEFHEAENLYKIIITNDLKNIEARVDTTLISRFIFDGETALSYSTIGKEAFTDSELLELKL